MTKAERDKSIKLLESVGYSHVGRTRSDIRMSRTRYATRWGIKMQDKDGNTVRFDDKTTADNYVKEAFPTAADYDKWCETGELPDTMK
jgi:hypothetical protein